MNSSKLLWSGLTCIVALNQFGAGVPWTLLGAILMVIGLILLLLDK